MDFQPVQGSRSGPGFAGLIQEIVRDPEITICVLSSTLPKI